MHASLPRRPLRTSQRDEPRRSRSATSVTVLSEGVELRSGAVRSIAVLSRDGDDPVLCLSVRLDGIEIHRALIHRRQLAPLAAAVAAARAGGFDGRRAAGVVDHGPVELHIWAHCAPDLPPAVVLARCRKSDGWRLGGATAIEGAELIALERACELLAKEAA